MRTVSRALLWAALFALPAPAALAQDTPQPGLLHSLTLGLLAHDVDGLWSGHREESGLDVELEAVFARAGFQAPGGRIRPNLGVTLNTSGDTSFAYAGFVWEFTSRRGLFLQLGAGAAWHDGETETRGDEDKKELGSRWLFRIPIELGFAVGEHHRVSVAFVHVSNAGLADENEGLDTLGLRYGYRF